MFTDLSERKVGVGICTCNRVSLLEKLVPKVYETASCPIKLVIADDGSTDETPNYLKSNALGQNFEYEIGPRLGPANNKNRLLRRLKDCDFIFLLEDDIILRKAGWMDFFIQTYEKSGIHHLLFCPEWYYGKSKCYTFFGDVTVSHPLQDGGVFIFLTKRVLGVAGGFHPDFHGYGREHCEYTERIYRFGLSGKHKINHVVGSENFLDFISDRSAYDDVRKAEEIRNEEIWMRLREQPLRKVEL